MTRWMFVVSTAVLGVVVACSGSTSNTGSGDGGTTTDSGADAGTHIETKDFDTSCTADSDCAPVTSGDACVICLCPNDAVAKKDLAAYQAKFQAARNACGPMPAIACAADCQASTVTCSAAKKCVFSLGTNADAGDGG